MAPPCILLLEDDAATRDGLCMLLEDAGYTVVPAADGQRAINLLADGLRVDLLLVDLRTPRVSGAQVLRYVQEDPALREVPVIVTTGMTPADVHVTADLVFEKPYDVMALLDAVQRLRPSSRIPAP